MFHPTADSLTGKYYVSDPSTNPPTSSLLSKPYLASRARLVDLSRTVPIQHGNPTSSSDTIYLATADKEGNSCSFIASNYAGTFLFTPMRVEYLEMEMIIILVLTTKALEQVQSPLGVDLLYKIVDLDSR